MLFSKKISGVKFVELQAGETSIRSMIGLLLI